MSRLEVLFLSGLAAWVIGCTGTDAATQDTGDVADTDTDTDTDSDTDTDTDTDTGSTANIGLLIRVGVAQADLLDYTGTEALEFTDDKGYGSVVCGVSYDLTTVAPRSDCKSCEWAFDLELSNAAVTLDSGACLAALGYDASTVSAALDGTQVSYGYTAEYFGHAAVLMVNREDGKGWRAGNYALWDELTTTFNYTWPDGLLPF